MRHRLAIVGIILSAGFVLGPALAQSGDKASCPLSKAASAAQAAQCDLTKAQTHCPIKGGEIDRNVFVDTAGYRFYACCRPCLDKIKADPAKALATLKAKGQTPELRLVVCTKCGDIKGTAKCCKPDATKCSACDLNKGSIGCCKDLKAVAAKTCPVTGAQCATGKDKAKCCTAGTAKSSEATPAKGAGSCCSGQKSAAGQQDIVICAGCGEVKGSGKCCKADARKCAKCGLNKGAPGCCKLGEFRKGDA